MNSQEKTQEETTQVIVTDIRMTFYSIVVFMVKWVLAASIPALLILVFISLFFVGFFGSIVSFLNYP